MGGSSCRTALPNTLDSAARTSAFGTLTRSVSSGYSHGMWRCSYKQKTITT